MVAFNSHAMNGSKSGSVELQDGVWNSPLAVHVLSEVVNWQRAKRRRGTQSTKTKGEVIRTTQKPYKQKGTGNARQGSWVNPHMRGGGVALGPKPRSYSYSLPKTKRRVALATALSLKVSEENLIVVDDLSVSEIKTKTVASMLSKLNASSAVVVDIENSNLEKSCRNLKSARYLNVDGINVYDLLKYEKLVISKSAVSKLESRLIG